MTCVLCIYHWNRNQSNFLFTLLMKLHFFGSFSTRSKSLNWFLFQWKAMHEPRNGHDGSFYGISMSFHWILTPLFIRQLVALYFIWKKIIKTSNEIEKRTQHIEFLAIAKEKKTWKNKKMKKTIMKEKNKIGKSILLLRFGFVFSWIRATFSILCLFISIFFSFSTLFFVHFIRSFRFVCDLFKYTLNSWTLRFNIFFLLCIGIVVVLLFSALWFKIITTILGIRNR